MEKKHSIFGWDSVFKSYTNCDLIKDSIFPALTAVSITVISYLGEKDMLVELFKVITIGLSVVPVMLSILLAAYAILMSMYWSPICEKMKYTAKGNKLLNGLNSSFAAAIRIICFGVLYLLIVNSIGVVNMPFNIIPPNIINALLLTISLYFILFSIWIMKDIAISIYNFASFSVNTEIKEKKEDEKKGL